MNKKIFGFSLIEMLIVVGVFSVLAVVMTQTLASSLRGSKKSENLGKVRENVEYTMNYIERTLRTAKRLDSTCTGTNLVFMAQSGSLEAFKYVGTMVYYDTNLTDASNGTAISNTQVRIENDAAVPAFSCAFGASGEPDTVSVTLTANDASTTSSAESATYTGTTVISLRNYSRN